MKTKLLFTLVMSLFLGKDAFAQTPTYTLKVDSMKLLHQAPYYNNVIEFGVYMTHTNAPTSFVYQGQQIFFSFNPGIISGNPLDSANILKYIKIGSQLPITYQPRNPSIGTATSPSQTIMRLAINAFQNGGIDITGATNLLVVRMRLWNRTGPFNKTCLSMAFRNPPIVSFATRVFATIVDVNTDITTPSTHSVDSTGIPCPFPLIPPPLILKLSVLPEGLYYRLVNLLVRRDTVKTYLRNVVSPYNIADSSIGVIDSISFTNKFFFNSASPGTYYIQVNHFNSIETWSKSGGEGFSYGDTLIYDLTSSNTQAYGNNLKPKGSKYCIYSGDVNQDLLIDGTDLARIENDAYTFQTGRFLPSDLNGDNVVDGFDLLIGDNNHNYIHTISPVKP